MENEDSDWLDAALAVGSGVLLAAATRRRVKPTGKINAGVDTSKFGSYRPNRTLLRDKHGNNIPDENVPHTQLGTKKGRNGEYTQAREWGYDSHGKLVPKRDIDFTDHGRPAEHNRPHQHDYVPNSTGGTLKRDNEISLEMPE
ncbi:hypothetical protein [Pasteurella sp. PK-2025]|uniref:hypothetical protein n=1 Tax=unclassified Pasteurella TaxID=2621516 RepID=UPI003C7882DB